MNISNYSIQPISNVSSSSSEQRPASEPFSNKSADLHADRVDISTAGYEALKDSQGGESIDPRNASYHDIEKLANRLVPRRQDIRWRENNDEGLCPLGDDEQARWGLR